VQSPASIAWIFPTYYTCTLALGSAAVCPNGTYAVLLAGSASLVGACTAANGTAGDHLINMTYSVVDPWTEAVPYVSSCDAIATNFGSVCAASLVPGGRLVIVDDFISREGGSRNERRMVEAFRHGWLLPSLCPVGRAVRAAAARGLRLIEDRDLSGSLAPSPVVARMGGWMAHTMRAIPVPGQYWRSTAGSLARASCQRAGLVECQAQAFPGDRIHGARGVANQRDAARADPFQLARSGHRAGSS